MKGMRLETMLNVPKITKANIASLFHFPVNLPRLIISAIILALIIVITENPLVSKPPINAFK